jgi:hypothetical protein
MIGYSHQASAGAEQQWKQHDRNRPEPRVITPGTESTQDQPGKPPSDALILFDGKDLSAWESVKGGPAPWKVGDGYLEVVPHTGNIKTKQAFVDCQLHLEWATPDPPHGQDQGRGNSGVIMINLVKYYEIQVLDSYQNKTYPDGQAGAIYGEYPPLVNACRPPGQWQAYDIIMHGPRFDTAGKVVRPASFTVLQNGVLVQDHVTALGVALPVREYQPYSPHATDFPLTLQDHGQPVRFRNIWVRVLPEAEQ